MIAIFLGLLLLLFLFGMPAALSMGVTTLVVVAIERGIDSIPFTIIAQRMLYGANSFTLLAIPFFLLAGNLMNAGGITDRIFTFAKAMVGHWRGGMGHVNIVSSMIFSGMSGSAVADAMGLGTVEIKAMRDAGYEDDICIGVTAASATIGPIIPPSIPLVIFGVLANASIADLLIAGIAPGFAMGFALMVMLAIQARIRGYPPGERPSLEMFLRSLAKAILPILTPVILVGGIWTGLFTPTEAAAVAVVYAAILTGFVYRLMTVRKFWEILRRTMYDTAAIMLIIAAANLYGWFLVFAKIPQDFAALMQAVTSDPVIILLMINTLLLIVGCFMESLAAITVLTPILLPVAVGVGIHPVQFGIIMVLNLMIGLLTPPLGMVAFAVGKVAGSTMDKTIKAIIPYYIPLLICLLAVNVFPWLTLGLPSLFKG